MVLVRGGSWGLLVDADIGSIQELDRAIPTAPSWSFARSGSGLVMEGERDELRLDEDSDSESSWVEVCVAEESSCLLLSGDGFSTLSCWLGIIDLDRK